MSKDSQSSKDVSVGGSTSSFKPVRRKFPGPQGAEAPLRVAFDREPHAEVIAHAKSSLQAEVCGVLVGQICEDEQGPFVHVQAAIRGAAAGEGSTHVTFTQDTWQHIHAVMDRQYPKLRMVGWYHTHPGFGVEFSEMDLFIQRNFFSGDSQIAFVTDPLNGESAIITSLPEKGVTYLPHYWVDGKQQTAVRPKGAVPEEAVAGAAVEGGGISSGAMQQLEGRINQLTQALDGMRTDFYRAILFSFFLICTAVILGVGYFIHHLYKMRNEPPQLNGFVPVPVQIGDKRVLLGVNVAQWEIPPEMDALIVEAVKQKVEADKKAEAEAAKQAKEHPEKAAEKPAAPAPDAAAPPSPTPAPGTAPTTTPAPSPVSSPRPDKPPGS